ncbi:hypothetical protein ACO0LL_29140 [Undibacterium sp. TC4M20W]|uniref:hypothetical protein n=1 Tax=Undibacterium sp. TC4M20W TaxID=3413052 RepID=UPI003BF27284
MKKIQGEVKMGFVILILITWRAEWLMQAELFSQIGIDEYITRLGQEPIWYKVDGWTATIELMNKMGIKNVEANPNYASANYLKRNLIANIQSGGEPIVFGLDSAGKIVTLNQIPPEPQ